MVYYAIFIIFCNLFCTEKYVEVISFTSWFYQLIEQKKCLLEDQKKRIHSAHMIKDLLGIELCK